MHATGDSLAQLAGFLDGLPCGAALLDRAGRFLHVNRRLAEGLAKSPDELTHFPVRELFADEEARHAVDRLLTTGAAPFARAFTLHGAGAGHGLVVMAAALIEAPPIPDGLTLLTMVDVSALLRSSRYAREQYREITRLTDTVLEQALELKRHAAQLEERVDERTQELLDANMAAVFMLALAGEAKDADTGQHVRRIEQATFQTARRLGFAESEARDMGVAAILHDVGKMAVPDGILKKPGPLSAEERREMQLHTIAGDRILDSTAYFDLARRIARGHHENWDGSGYPDGKTGEEIPLAARVVRVADVYDALTHERVYKSAWPARRAREEIRRGAGSRFDPEVTRAFLDVLRNGDGQTEFEKETGVEA